MTTECDKCGQVKCDVRIVDSNDGLRMMCGGCASRGGVAAAEEEEG